MRPSFSVAVRAAGLAAGLAAAAHGYAGSLLPEVKGWKLQEFAAGDRQWTGVAVSPEGRLFANFPRWAEMRGFSVIEFLPGGGHRPYPGAEWNQWTADVDPKARFACVQSVVADRQGFLWILDSGNPRFEGVIPGAPKLVKVDLKTDQVVRVFPFETPAVETASYLNDVRIDPSANAAYLTDSGTGALIVLDLETGTPRRLLAGHPSTKGEETVLYVGKRPWKRNGVTPQVHADGLALSPDGRFLYYQALSGRTLYRVLTAALRDPKIPPEDLANAVEIVGRPGAADGLEFDGQGNLLLTAIEYDAIHRLTPEGKLECLAQSREIRWPDSLAVGPDGAIYFTTSQIHLDRDKAGPYKIFRLVPPKP